MNTKPVASLVNSSCALLGAAVLALSALPARSLPIITNVVETGGDNEATDTVTAKYTGITFTNGIEGEFLTPFLVPVFGEDVPAYVDRKHQWNGAATNVTISALSYLAGGEYIMIGNDNRDNAQLKLDVTVSQAAIVFVLVDNRLTDGSGDDPPEAGRPLSTWTGMSWLHAQGFAPVQTGRNRRGDASVPDEVGVDENGDATGPGGSIQNWSSVYSKVVPAGTFSLLQADSAGRNMYGVVVKSAVATPALQALFVHGATPSVSDLAISNRLVTLGYTVTGVTAPNSQTANADGKNLILVSSTVSSGDLLVDSVHKFRDSVVPLINWESANYDDLGMTGTAATDFGAQTGVTNINIVNASHPLARGLRAGTNVIFSAATDVAWGLAGAKAIVVGRQVGNDARAILFGFERGDVMANGRPAPERRIGLPLTDNSGVAANASGIALFDAAIQWANPTLPMPSVVGHPSDATAVENTTATFTGEAHGARPFSYQWLKSNVAVPGATNRTAAIPVTFADNGATISLQVSNASGTAVSKSAKVTVTADTTVPAAQTASTRGNANQIVVTFSKPVGEASALNLANYVLNQGANITGAVLGATPDTVVLTTSTLNAATAYSLFIADVTDRAARGNVITPNPTRLAVLQSQGFITRRFWQYAADPATIAFVTNNPAFPNNPTSVSFEPNFEYPPNGGNEAGANYGSQFVGYIHPPLTGDYIFYVSGDDEISLYLSTDENPVNRRLIAAEPQWNNARQWRTPGSNAGGRNKTNPENRSAPVRLEAGKKYFVEVLHNEGGGGDSVGVTWQLPGVTTDPAQGSPPISGAFLSSHIPSGAVTLTRQPAPVTSGELGSVTFSVDASGTPPFSYQWRANGTAIAGATGPSFTVSSAALAQSGTKYSVEVKNAFSSATSAEAALSVTPDVAVPTLDSARGAPSLTHATLNFSEPIALDYTATLTGAAERPNPVNTTATGRGTLTLAGNTLTFNITYSGLSATATAAHFHAPAGAEAAAGVAINLAPFNGGAFGASGTLAGSVTLTADQFNWLANGLMYINIHTAANPGGEIRGQVVPVLTGLSIAGLNVTGASLGADGRSIVLSTSQQDPGTTYAATVSGIRDISSARNVIAPNSSVAFTSFVVSNGYLLREVYTGISGSAIANLTSAPSFPNTPNVVELIPSFETPTSYADNYGQRVSGFVTAPETGNYVFFISCDDNGELYLSTDENPSNKKLIAREAAWSNSRQWLTSGGSSTLAAKRSDQFAESQWPTPRTITLTAGKRYYIEALHKEGGGGDNLGVAWKLPSQANPPADGSPPISGAFLSTAANPVGAVITFTRQPESVTVPEATPAPTATFTALATGRTATSTNVSVTYQWARNGELIAGAAGSSYTTPPLTPANNGDLYVVLASIPGRQLFSLGAVLTVNADTKAPALVSANTFTRPNKVTVLFSEAVSRATATNTANYKISDAFPILSAEQIAPNTVELTTPGTKPLMEFDFNEGSGTAVTSRDGKLTGAFVGRPTFSADSPSGLRGDYSLQFAAGQRVAVPDPAKVLALDPSDASFTIQAWLKFTTPAARSVFFYNNGPGGAVSASVFTNRTAFVTTLGIVDQASQAAIPNDGGWHHMAVVHDRPARQIRFYVDGVLGHTVTNYNGNAANPSGVNFSRTEQVFYIGSEPTGGLQYVGNLDRLKYSKGALTPNELELKALPAIARYGIGLNFGANEAGGIVASNALAGAPLAVQANWNNLNGANGTNRTIVADAPGASTTAVAVVWGSNGTWASGTRGEPNGTNFDVGTPHHNLLEGYLDTGNATTTSVTVSNIPPQLTSGGYDVIVYALGGVNARGGGYRIVDPASGAVLKDYVRAQSPNRPTNYVQVPVPPPTGTHGEGTHIVFGGLKANAIKIEATTAGGFGLGSPPRAPINAVQLISAAAAPAGGSRIFSEDFNSLALGPNVEEGITTGSGGAKQNVWTKTPPASWVVDDRGVPGAGTANDGVKEWAGWSFADRAWWAATAGDQQRTQFLKGTGAIAIADGDEWDDLPRTAGTMNTFLSTRPIDVAGQPANGLSLKFDSSWRDEPEQKANIRVSYDGGAPIEVLRWESVAGGANFHDDAPNETVTVALKNPAGAKSMVITFGYLDAGNNWWWAIDNLEVIAAAGPAEPAKLSAARTGTGLSLTWTGTAVLESADAITGPWAAVSNATSPFAVQPTAARKFYRLKQ